VKVAADPTSCVVLGLGRMLDEMDLLKRVAGPA
jgi:actin-like ATPase involved in cell morphogenesis